MPTVIAAVLVTAALLGPNAAADVNDLPRGADTTTPYFSGRTLHVDGTTLMVPGTVGDSNSSFVLVGSTARGWVVAHIVHGSPLSNPVRWELYLVTAAGATKIRQGGYRENPAGDPGYFRLSDNRTRVLVWIRDVDEDIDFAYATVLDLGGTVLNQRRFSGHAHALDFSGRRIVLSSPGGATRIWRLGTKPRVLAERRPVLADFEHDALILKGSHGRFGPTSLSRPGRLRWQGRFTPLRLSPDGRRVVGFATRKTGHPIEVRRMRDGRVVASWARNGISEYQGDLTWETSGAALYGGISGGTASLVRCTVHAGCVLASDPVPTYVQFEFQPDR